MWVPSMVVQLCTRHCTWVYLDGRLWYGEAGRKGGWEKRRKRNEMLKVQELALAIHVSHTEPP